MAAANVAARCVALAQRRGDEVVRVPGAVCVRSADPWPGASRAVVLDPADAEGAEIAAAYAGHRGGVRVEDPFAAVDLAPHGFEPEWEMDLMARAAGVLAGPEGGKAGRGTAPAGREPAALGAAVAVERVSTLEGLELAERTIVAGFPMRARDPGSLLAPELLDIPGYAVWLARADGAPAAAMASYDDGASLGIYYLATLPAARRRGAGRALLAAAIASALRRPAILTATRAGEPLYAACGFAVAGRAAWWWRG